MPIKPGLSIAFEKRYPFLCARGCAAVVGAGFAKVFTAYIFIAALSVLAAKPAAFIAKEFHFIFLGLGQVVQLFKFFI